MTIRYLVKKSTLRGEIAIPPSKSHTLRAILFGLLADGKSVIRDPLTSPDTFAMVQACRLLGGKISTFPNKIEIEGVGGKITGADNVINAGNSGIVLRFCTAVGALGKRPVVITGDDSICHCRPIKPLLKGLSDLGVSCETMKGDGFAPVVVKGPIIPGIATISGEDSQPVSALLIASAFTSGPIDINVVNAGEKPWVGLTLNWFDRLKIPYQHDNFHRYKLFGNARYDGFEYQVPGDLSTAAFPIAAALITRSELTLKNVDLQDCQGDKQLISVFKDMGADIAVDEESKTLIVKKGMGLKGILVDINEMIDALPILAAVACYAEGKTHIYNGAIAKQKECNRIHCLALELKKMGAKIEETEDGLIIEQSHLVGASLHSHNDHRMAMSLAIAALGADGETMISQAECVVKTFPTFAEDFQTLGASIKVLA